MLEEARRNRGGSPPDVVHAALVTELEARGLVLDTSVVAEAARDTSEHRSHQVEGDAETGHEYDRLTRSPHLPGALETAEDAGSGRGLDSGGVGTTYERTDSRART